MHWRHLVICCGNSVDKLVPNWYFGQEVQKKSVTLATLIFAELCLTAAGTVHIKHISPFVSNSLNSDFVLGQSSSN
jgi:hypothetical protein